MAKWAPLSDTWRVATQYRELAESMRRYQDSLPKINPELLQMLARLGRQSELPQLPASFLESVSKIKDMNQRLAEIAGANGLTTSIAFNKQLLEAALQRAACRQNWERHSNMLLQWVDGLR
jgi:hypothetical protein